MAKRKQLTFEELLDRELGREGTEGRQAFEMKARLFELSEMIKSARKEAGMTQQQLADKIGSQKSYISRIENGDCDLRYSTLIRIFEDAFGKSLNIVAE
ncbi:helix-turn-helix transcriptional regulator [Rurimicrobium arvi]|uniref:HTH cro/C1-type domain-containing protein n=1 Tax=Rurimicrobium arvi TaxID=2049916 RepID=A0ABP8MF94_9BACT